MGSIGGALWHSFKGYRNSPRGERFTGAITAVKARAPVLGGNFAVWGGLFSTFDCTIAGTCTRGWAGWQHGGKRTRTRAVASCVMWNSFLVQCNVGIRQKEDPWNSIASGALAGAVLSARAGPRAAAMSAVVGGVLLALMEGIGIAIGRASAGAFKPVAPIIPDLPQTAPTAPLSPYADNTPLPVSSSTNSTTGNSSWQDDTSQFAQGQQAQQQPPPPSPAKPKGRFGFI